MSHIKRSLPLPIHPIFRPLFTLFRNTPYFIPHTKPSNLFLNSFLLIRLGELFKNADSRAIWAWQIYIWGGGGVSLFLLTVSKESLVKFNRRRPGGKERREEIVRERRKDKKESRLVMLPKLVSLMIYQFVTCANVPSHFPTLTPPLNRVSLPPKFQIHSSPPSPFSLLVISMYPKKKNFSTKMFLPELCLHLSPSSHLSTQPPTPHDNLPCDLLSTACCPFHHSRLIKTGRCGGGEPQHFLFLGFICFLSGPSGKPGLSGKPLMGML